MNRNQDQPWPRDDREAEERDERAQARISSTLGRPVPRTRKRDLAVDICNLLPVRLISK